MMMPRKAMDDDLKQQEKELTDDVNNLNKKVNLHFIGTRKHDNTRGRVNT